MVRKAELDDLPQIMKIVADVKEEMHRAGNPQWDDEYPQEKDFRQDIENRDLYVKDNNGLIYGFICLNYSEPDEYHGLNWSLDDKCLVLHRMAVNSNFRNQGTGMLLMQFAEELAQREGVTSIKSDTNSANPKMNALFQKLHYRYVGEIIFLGRSKPFNCYEKILGS